MQSVKILISFALLAISAAATISLAWFWFVNFMTVSIAGLYSMDFMIMAMSVIGLHFMCLVTVCIAGLCFVRSKCSWVVFFMWSIDLAAAMSWILLLRRCMFTIAARLMLLMMIMLIMMAMMWCVLMLIMMSWEFNWNIWIEIKNIVEIYYLYWKWLKMHQCKKIHLIFNWTFPYSSDSYHSLNHDAAVDDVRQIVRFHKMITGSRQTKRFAHTVRVDFPVFDDERLMDVVVLSVDDDRIHSKVVQVSQCEGHLIRIKISMCWKNATKIHF